MAALASAVGESERAAGQAEVAATGLAGDAGRLQQQVRTFLANVG